MNKASSLLHPQMDGSLGHCILTAISIFLNMILLKKIGWFVVKQDNRIK